MALNKEVVVPISHPVHCVHPRQFINRAQSNQPVFSQWLFLLRMAILQHCMTWLWSFLLSPSTAVYRCRVSIQRVPASNRGSCGVYVYIYIYSCYFIYTAPLDPLLGHCSPCAIFVLPMSRCLKLLPIIFHQLR